MNKELVYNDLLKIVNEEDIKIDEPMKKHISFRVGGPADILVRPRTEEQLSQILKYIDENALPYLIIGNELISKRRRNKRYSNRIWR